MDGILMDYCVINLAQITDFTYQTF